MMADHLSRIESGEPAKGIANQFPDASLYKRLGLGLRLLALATNPPSNIWSMATT